MSTCPNDVKYALRQLRKNPGFTTVTMLTLALGIGANLGLFGILNEMLLRPKPVARPFELWAIQAADAIKQPVRANLCRPYYEAIQRERHLFEGLIGYARIRPKLKTEEGVERIQAELVSGDYFSFLGVPPVLGRGFYQEEDTQAGARAVAVISYAFWQNRFGRSADVLGKTFTLNKTLIEIVGVAPRGFKGLDFKPSNLWLPASLEPLLGESTRYHLVGRLTEPKLAPTIADLLTPITAEVTKKLLTFEDPRWFRYGVSPRFARIRLDPIGRGLLGTSYLKPRVISFLQLAGVATVLLLLIAGANVAGLFLARALQRRKETATRVALGATRMAIVRPIVCEGMLVAAGATMGALLILSWVNHIILSFISWWPGAPLPIVPDLHMLLFAIGVVLVVGMGSSMIPALQASRFNPCTALKDGQGTSRKRRRLYQGLIVTQIVGSLVLLCGAMLCLRSMGKQLDVDLGYDHDRLVIASLDLERIGFTKDTFAPQLADIVRRVKHIPGVQQVCATPAGPLGGTHYLPMAHFPPEGYDLPVDDPREYDYFPQFAPGMFAVLGIPMLRGREFRPEDIKSGRHYIVINECLAQTFWSDQNPLGKHIGKREIIGVVKDARLGRFDKQPVAAVFRVTKREALLHPHLLIRTTGNARRVLSSVRAQLGQIHPRLAESEVCMLRDIMKNALAFQHAAMRILGALGILALVLAAVGTYGVIAYMINSQTRDIGIRLAIGATPGDVLRFVLSKGLRLGLIALVIGLPLTLGTAIVLRHEIAGVSPFDPVSFAAVAACTLVVLIAACWLPARRAARIDPMEALRCE